MMKNVSYTLRPRIYSKNTQSLPFRCTKCATVYLHRRILNVAARGNRCHCNTLLAFGITCNMIQQQPPLFQYIILRWRPRRQAMTASRPYHRHAYVYEEMRRYQRCFLTRGRASSRPITMLAIHVELTRRYILGEVHVRVQLCVGYAVPYNANSMEYFELALSVVFSLWKTAYRATFSQIQILCLMQLPQFQFCIAPHEHQVGLQDVEEDIPHDTIMLNFFF